MPVAAYIPPPDPPTPPTPTPEPAAKPASQLIPKGASANARNIRGKVLAYIRACGNEGSTSEQAELALHMPHQTVSARITELRTHRTYGGRITYLMDGKKKVRRATLSGRTANVYVAVPPISLAQ